MNKNDNDKVIEIILEDLKEVKKDVKDLVNFKYKLLGMVTMGSFLFSFVINLIFKSF
jgi:hypothetical protein